MSEVEPPAPGRRDAITDVRGVRVGHWTSRRKATGCTVILCEGCTGAAVDVRGGAPATHETDALAGENLVRRCHAVVLTGGSAFGLASTAGVASWLAARGVGVETRAGPVPIVVAAGIFDLQTGQHAYPGADEGQRAAARATGGSPSRRGAWGQGRGRQSRSCWAVEQALKGGVGTASLVGPRGLVVGALAVTNAVGAVFDPETGAMVAGPRGDGPGEMRTPEQAVVERREEEGARENTSLVCVATNASIEHIGVRRLAVHGHDGLARSIVPAHTLGDGDTVFALTTGRLPRNRTTSRRWGSWPCSRSSGRWCAAWSWRRGWRGCRRRGSGGRLGQGVNDPPFQ